MANGTEQRFGVNLASVLRRTKNTLQRNVRFTALMHATKSSMDVSFVVSPYCELAPLAGGVRGTFAVIQ
jgi:hypothetical protein